MRPAVSRSRPPGSRSSSASSSSGAAMLQQPTRTTGPRSRSCPATSMRSSNARGSRRRAGHLGRAVALARQASEAIPLPQFVSLLGDLLARQGHQAEARRQQATVAAIDRLLVAGGVKVDLESAVFRADHLVRPAENVELARQARAARPSIYGDDALGWALARAGRCEEASTWSQRSLRLGTRDALLWFHRGYAAGCAGDRAGMKSLVPQGARPQPAFLGAVRTPRPGGHFVRRLLLVLVTGIAATGALAAPRALRPTRLATSPSTTSRPSTLPATPSTSATRSIWPRSRPSRRGQRPTPGLCAALARKLELTVDGRRVQLVVGRTAPRSGPEPAA